MPEKRFYKDESEELANEITRLIKEDQERPLLAIIPRRGVEFWKQSLELNLRERVKEGKEYFVHVLDFQLPEDPAGQTLVNVDERLLGYADTNAIYWIDDKVDKGRMWLNVNRTLATLEKPIPKRIRKIRTFVCYDFLGVADEYVHPMWSLERGYIGAPEFIRSQSNGIKSDLRPIYERLVPPNKEMHNEVRRTKLRGEITADPELERQLRAEYGSTESGGK